jgi:hypothetical protein
MDTYDESTISSDPPPEPYNETTASLDPTPSDSKDSGQEALLGAFARIISDGNNLLKKLQSTPGDAGEKIFEFAQSAVQLTDNLGRSYKSLLKTAYNPLENNRPIEPPPLITINDVPILSVGGIATITSLSGSGKTRVFNAMVAGGIDENCDSLGFKVQIPQGKKMVMFDTEETRFESHRMLEDDLCQRLGKSKLDLIDRYIPLTVTELSIDDRKSLLYQLIEKEKPALVIIDGIADLILDVNSIAETVIVIDKIRSLAIKNDCGIYMSIHQNLANSERFSSTAPRGHTGREIWRRSQSVLSIQKDSEIYKLTSKCSAGKVRWGAAVEYEFMWDNNIHRFISISPEKRQEIKDRHPSAGQKLHALAQQLLLIKIAPWSHSELSKAIANEISRTPDTAKKWIPKLIEAGLAIQDRLSGVYSLVNPMEVINDI